MDSYSQNQLLSTSFWQKIDFFRGVPSELLKNILRDAEVVATSSKKIIFYEGDRAEHFGFVIDGIFKLHRLDYLGHSVAMDFVTSGGMVAGLLMAAEDSIYPVTVQSIKAGSFLKIPKSTFDRYWCNSADIMKKVQIANMERVSSMQTMRDGQRLPLEQKIAWILVKLLAKLFENDKFLKIYFSRVDISDAIGAAPASVIRVFSKWTKDGLIEIKGGEEFVNLEKLNTIYFNTFDI